MTSASPTPARGFTLLETTIVVALIAMLMTLAAGSLHGITMARRLTTAAAVFENDLRMTAMFAVKENRSIYLRFKQTGDPPQYRDYQLIALDPVTGLLQELNAPQQLPDGIVFVDHADYSNILRLTPATSPGLFLGFTRSGGTTLPKAATDRWCLMLAEESKIIPDAKKPPRNYRVIVINAHTGSVAVY